MIEMENIDYLIIICYLQFMCEIKGSKANFNEINDLIKKIGLSEKATCLAKTLSGGQKRKRIGPIHSVTLVEKLDFLKPLKFSKTFFGLPLQLC